MHNHAIPQGSGREPTPRPAKIYDFHAKLQASKQNKQRHIEAIKSYFPDALGIREGRVDEDIQGADFIVMLAGKNIAIDVKTRERGCSKYWRNRKLPEAALEIWSAAPTPERPQGIKGWCRDPAKKTDFILFIFDNSDTEKTYLIPFEMLRTAYSLYGSEWAKNFKIAKQKTPSFKANGDDRFGECIFIPLVVIRAALNQIMFEGGV